MIIVRLNIFSKTSFWESFCHLGVTKLKALPTANKKDGNTRSVGVNPFQEACSRNEKLGLPPGVFTTIIRQMVMPRKTSNAVKRWVDIADIRYRFQTRI